MNRPIWQKPRLHEDPHQHRKVTWLELFFDLVFVVVISELVHLLSLDIQGITNYVFLFIPAWWIWIGVAYYNDRFETEGLDSRLFTFILMLPVAGLAIFSHHISHDNYVGYGICYSVARLLILILWSRAAIHEPRFRPVAQVLMVGYGVSIALFMGLLWVSAYWKMGLWGLALICDLITPLLTLKRQRFLPYFNLIKLPERLGLFMLIVMGETLVAVIRGVARHHHFHFRIVSEGVLAIAISFTLWWIYFDHIADHSPKQHHKTFFLWSYLHMILAMAIGGVGASVLSILTAKHHIPTDGARWMIVGSLTIAMVLIALIQMVLSETPERKESIQFKLATAVTLVLIGIFGHEMTSMGLLSLIFGAMMIPITAPAIFGFATDQNR